MRRGTCAGCGGELTDFLDLGQSPLADAFPQDAAVQEKWYTLTVAVCTFCWLAQLREVVPDDELYGKDYGFRTGSSPAAVRYFGKLAEELLARFGERDTIEIACNDGTLLENFSKAGCQVLGVEPTPAAGYARSLGLPVETQPFTRKLAADIREARGTAGLVIACNVAAHVADPLDFLAGIRDLLAQDGVAVIEFQDLADLVAGCQFDHVYHEHRFYYSFASFRRLANAAGLRVFDGEHTQAQGGSLRVFLRRGNDMLFAGDSWLEGRKAYDGMQERAVYAKQKLLSLIGDEMNEGRVIAGYGASAKSATLFNYCHLSPRNVSWVEDLTPGKIGRVTPGSHIPIYGPDHKNPDTYLLTSHNYLSSIVRKESTFLASGGRFIVPAAVPFLILGSEKYFISRGQHRLAGDRVG